MISLLLCLGASLAADVNKPHPHQGVREPYGVPPATPALDEAELAELAAGKPVKRQLKTDAGGQGKGGRGVAIQDVHASPETIWAQITDFDSYTSKVDNVYLCELRRRSGEHIEVHFIIGAMMVKAEYWIDHTHRPDQGYMTWTLDYDHESDLDDSVGFWRVEALPERPGWSRVTYSVDVQVRGWVPGFIEDLMTKSGLTKATAWVKRESEKVERTAP